MGRCGNNVECIAQDKVLTTGNQAEFPQLYKYIHGPSTYIAWRPRCQAVHTAAGFRASSSWQQLSNETACCAIGSEHEHA